MSDASSSPPPITEEVVRNSDAGGDHRRTSLDIRVSQSNVSPSISPHARRRAQPRRFILRFLTSLIKPARAHDLVSQSSLSSNSAPLSRSIMQSSKYGGPGSEGTGGELSETYLSTGIYLRCRRQTHEDAFIKGLQTAYVEKTGLVGFFYTLYLTVMNVVPGYLVHQRDLPTLTFIWAGSFGSGILLALYLSSCSLQRWSAQKAEITCYTALLINPATVCMIALLFHRRNKLQPDNLPIPYTEEVYWTLEWSSIMASLVLMDCWQPSRTKTVFICHVLLSVLIVTSKIAWCNALADFAHLPGSGWEAGLRPGEAEKWIATLQAVLLVAVIWQMYIARYMRELGERLAFVARLRHQNHLKRLQKLLRAEENDYNTKSYLSVPEKVLLAVKRACVSVLALAFKSDPSGDLYLLNVYNQLNACINIINDNAEHLLDSNLVRSDPLHLPGSGGRVDAGITASPAPSAIRLDDEADLFIIMPEMPKPTFEAAAKGLGADSDLNCLQLYKRFPDLLIYSATQSILSGPARAWLDHSSFSSYIFYLSKRHWNNPYHNTGHVAMVLHVANILATAFGYINDLDTQAIKTVGCSAPSLSILALQIACIGHDVGHGGRNNLFLHADGMMQPENMLYDLIGTLSLIESLSSHLTFRIAQIKGCNIFAVLDEKNFRILRRRVIELILSIDMSQHYALLGAFRLRVTGFDRGQQNSNAEAHLLTHKMILKAADLSHSATGWMEHLEWSTYITTEFVMQGDLEERFGYTRSPLCDRMELRPWAHSQYQYIGEVVMPVYTQLQGLAHGRSFDLILRRLQINQEQWRGLAAGDNVSYEAEVDATRVQFAKIAQQCPPAPLGYEESLLKISLLRPNRLITISGIDGQPVAYPMAGTSPESTPADVTPLPDEAAGNSSEPSANDTAEESEEEGSAVEESNYSSDGGDARDSASSNSELAESPSDQSPRKTREV